MRSKSPFLFIRAVATLFLALMLLSCATSAQNDATESKKIRAIVKIWSEAHNSKDVVELKNIVDSRLLYYAQNLSQREYLDYKRKIFLDKSNYYHAISGIRISAYENNIFKCDFIKYSQYKGAKKEYQMYLVIKKTGRRYLITAESDKERDQFLSYTLNLGKQITFIDLEDSANPPGLEDPNYFSRTALIIVLLLAILATMWLLYRKRS